MLKTKEEIDGLQQVVSDYLAKLLHGEIDRLWEEGELSEEKVESFRTLRERTHYNKQQL